MGYGGGILADGASALLVTDRVAYVVQVDGVFPRDLRQVLAPDTRWSSHWEIIDLKPGPHKLSVCYRTDIEGNTKYCQRNIPLPVTITAGKAYLVRYVDLGAGRWQAALDEIADPRPLLQQRSATIAALPQSGTAAVVPTPVPTSASVASTAKGAITPAAPATPATPAAAAATKPARLVGGEPEQSSARLLNGKRYFSVFGITTNLLLQNDPCEAEPRDPMECGRP